MNCPTCQKPLKPIGKTGRWRCVNPDCPETIIKSKSVQAPSPTIEPVTEIAGQSNSLSEGGESYEEVPISTDK